METQKTVIQAKPVTLNSTDQDKIITFVKDAWDKGKAARKKYKDHWEECEKAYHCEMPKIESPELDWMSNECLPWAYDAAESWFAHIHSTTIPKNDQIFTVSGRTQEDHPGANVMQKYLEYRFERNKFPQQLGEAYKQLVIKNHTCLKVYWREDITVKYQWVDEPVLDAFGYEQINPETLAPLVKRVKKPEEDVTFNNVWIDVVDVDNFVMYPIYGDIEKTTRIHETYRHYEDLIASADKTNYFNLKEIEDLAEKETESTNFQLEAEKTDCKNKGLNIKEAWIHRIKIGEKVYRNYVATIVNDKVLIRFQPNPYGDGRSPFIFMALRPDGGCLYGYGLNSKGLGILNAANKIFNARLDEMNLNIHTPHKYYDDGVFNPYNVISRPGAMIKMAQQGVQDNLIPLIENLAPMQQAMAEVAELKVEFETVTVPKVVKGMIEVGSNNTATEITQAQNNSNGKMHIDAFNINDKIIGPAIELTYQLIYDRMQFDDTIAEEIMLITQPKDENGFPMGELPVLPLPEVDIKIVGYQNVIRKQEQLQGVGQALPQLSESPAGKYLKWDNIGEDVLRLLDLDTDRLWANEDERSQIDKQEQQAQEEQQQLVIQQEMAKLELQKQKQDQDFQIKLQELELRRLELELKFQQQQHNEMMSEHQAQQDIETRKEKGDSKNG